MAGGIRTTIFLRLAIALLAGLVPILEEQAKKTPNPIDDSAIAALKAFLEFAQSGELKILLDAK